MTGTAVAAPFVVVAHPVESGSFRVECHLGLCAWQEWYEASDNPDTFWTEHAQAFHPHLLLGPRGATESAPRS